MQIQLDKLNRLHYFKHQILPVLLVPFLPAIFFLSHFAAALCVWSVWAHHWFVFIRQRLDIFSTWCFWLAHVGHLQVVTVEKCGTFNGLLSIAYTDMQIKLDFQMHANDSIMLTIDAVAMVTTCRLCWQWNENEIGHHKADYNWITVAPMKNSRKKILWSVCV